MKLTMYNTEITGRGLMYMAQHVFFVARSKSKGFLYFLVLLSVFLLATVAFSSEKAEAQSSDQNWPEGLEYCETVLGQQAWAVDVYNIDYSWLLFDDPERELVNPDLGAATNRRQVSNTITQNYNPTPTDCFAFRPKGSTSYATTPPGNLPASFNTTAAKLCGVDDTCDPGESAPRFLTTGANMDKLSSTVDSIIPGAAEGGGNLYYLESVWEQGGDAGASLEGSPVPFPNGSIVAGGIGLTRMIHIYYDCVAPQSNLDIINDRYGDVCPDEDDDDDDPVLTTCQSYDPYSPFPPLASDSLDSVEVTLTDTSIPSDYNTPASSQSTSWDSWSGFGAWSGSDTSQTRTQTRSGMQTRTRNVYTYEHFLNGDGSIQTTINSTADQWGDTTTYTGGGFSNGTTLQLDYTDHFVNYPYDPHHPEVKYIVYYTETEQPQDSSRDRLQTQTETRTRSDPDDAWGGSSSSTSTSNDPWSGWSNDGSSTETVESTAEKTQAAPQMPPCFPRSFYATPDLRNAELTPVVENPDQASVNLVVRVDFRADRAPGSPNDPMKLASMIRNLGYVITPRIERADGTTTTLTSSSDSFTISGDDSLQSLNNTDSEPYTLTVSVAPQTTPEILSAGDQVCWNVALNDNVGYVGSASLGTDPISGLIIRDPPRYPTTTDSNNTDDICGPRVEDQPYMAAFGADVIAGNGIGANCNTDNGGIIAGRYNVDRSQGSGAQFAAIAMAQIDQFASAKMRANTPLGLSFASNTGSYGGNYAGTHCITDYYAQMPSDLTPASNLNSELNGGPGQFAHSVDSAAINAAGKNKISNSRHITLYADGDVELARNIEYKNYNWTQAGEIPSFFLIVDGNLYIDKDVTQLDGIYIATGNIYTCSEGRNGFAVTSMFVECDEQLTVNGALIANTIKLNRSAQSSTRSDTQNQHPNITGSYTCATGVQRQLCAAEVINFSPELYLTNPSLPASSSPGQARYDAITTLPPVL